MSKITTRYKLLIPAGMASPGPPLGPVLGINIASFVREFNEKSSQFKKGLKIKVIVYQEGRNYKMDVLSPVTSSLIKSAAQVEKASADLGEICLKKVYEIAKMKKEFDPFLKYYDLKSICIKVIKQCNNMGIKVTPHFSAKITQKTIDETNFKNLYYNKNA